MGEIAEMMLEGMLCQVCGVFMGEGDGFAVTCAGCGGHEHRGTTAAYRAKKARMRKRKKLKATTVLIDPPWAKSHPSADCEVKK